jgi:hypothetical protein
MESKFKIFFTAAMLLLSGSLHLFAQSSNTVVAYSKSSQPGLVLELPYNTDVSEGYIVSNLKKTGYDPETKGKFFWKQNKLNGFYVFRGVNLPGAPGPLDLYFKVEQKSRIQKDHSFVYLLVSKGNEAFIAPESDTTANRAAVNFLNAFTEGSAVYKHDLDIKSQQEVVKSAEKKLIGLQDNEHSLNKKLQQLQDDLRRNKEQQDNQQKTIEMERKRLIDMQGQAQAPPR